MIRRRDGAGAGGHEEEAEREAADAAMGGGGGRQSAVADEGGRPRRRRDGAPDEVGDVRDMTRRRTSSWRGQPSCSSVPALLRFRFNCLRAILVLR